MFSVNLHLIDESLLNTHQAKFKYSLNSPLLFVQFKFRLNCGRTSNDGSFKKIRPNADVQMSSMAILCIKCDQHVQVHIDMIVPMCVLVLLFIVCCCALSFGRDRRRIKLYAQALRNAQIESCVRVKHIPSIFFSSLLSFSLSNLHTVA